MEETKYYTPAPEDIRIGMVYEYKRWADDEFGEWNKRIMPANGGIIQNVLERLSRDLPSVRVPYLTAEQIEAEGWKITKSDDLSIIFTNERVVFHYGYDGHYLTVLRMEPEDTIFMGKCRCVNDMRLICKLLGI